jgi:hypothetical protein
MYKCALRALRDIEPPPTLVKESARMAELKKENIENKKSKLAYTVKGKQFFFFSLAV